jgi:hypothetical protein
LQAQEGEADVRGDRQTFRRNGAAALSLERDGDRVTGTRRPDDGRVEGTVRARLPT